MWAVMAQKNGWWHCYAILDTEQSARKWAKRLECDGSVMAVCSIDKDIIAEAAESLRK